MADTERRPRIPATLADHLDELREDIPFETYVRNVLEGHVRRNLGEADESTYLRDRGGDRRHTYTDPEGAVVYVDKPTGEHHTHEDVEASIVISDEDWGAVGAYLTEAGLRGLRDVCTELLGEYE